MVKTFSYKIGKILHSYTVGPYKIKIVDSVYAEGPKYIVNTREDLIEVEKLIDHLLNNFSVSWNHSILDQLYDEAQRWFSDKQGLVHLKELIDATCKYAAARVLGIEKFFHYYLTNL